MACPTDNLLCQCCAPVTVNELALTSGCVLQLALHPHVVSCYLRYLVPSVRLGTQWCLTFLSRWTPLGWDNNGSVSGFS